MKTDQKLYNVTYPSTQNSYLVTEKVVESKECYTIIGYIKAGPGFYVNSPDFRNMALNYTWTKESAATSDSIITIATEDEIAIADMNAL